MTPKLSKGVAGCVMAALVAFAVATPAIAQQATTTGSIRGIVSGPDGSPLPSATVSATNVETGVRRGAQTDESGRYQIPFLDPGNYVFRAQRIGFRPAERTPTRIAIGQVQQVDFQLQPAATTLAAERIVAEAVPLIEPTKTGTSTRISEQQIQELPVNGRNFKDLVVLAPGVSDVGNTGSGGGQSIGGGRTGASNILMDGANNNESFFGGDARGGDRAPFSYSIEAVKEIQVITAGYDVERGQFTGGTVNAVTKSGTNRFSGSGFYYHREDEIGSLKLTANDYLGLPPTDFRSRQFGVSLGGPIMKDKLHFFFTLDKQVRTDPRPVFVGGASDAGIRASGIHPDTLANFLRIAQDVFGVNLRNEFGALATKTDEDAFFGRIDWQINDAHKLTLRDNYTTTNLTADRVFTGPTSTDFLSNGGNNDDQSNSFVGSLSSVFGRLTNEARVQFAFENKPRPSSPTGDLGVPLPQIQVRNIQSVLSNGQIQTTQATFGADPILHFNNLEQQTREFINNVRYSRGSHTFKVGANYLNVHVYNFFGNNGLGSFQFNSTQEFENNTPTQFTRNLPAPGFTQLPIQDFDVNEFSVYAQDEWQYNNKLFLNYGLRYDRASYDVDIQDNPKVRQFFPYLDVTTKPEDGDNISPRFGFTFDPRGNGVQVIRGGTGIFYGRTPYVVYGNILGATGIGNVQLNCNTTTGVPSVDLASYVDSYDNLPTACGDGGALTGGTPAVFTLDKNYEQSYAWKSNLAYDRLVAEKWRAGVEVVFSTVRDNWILQDDNFNPIERFQIEGGIPVFVDAGTISTANGSVNRNFSRRFPEFDRVGVYRSLGSTISTQTSFTINGRFDRGTWYSAYTYDNTEDNYSRGCCTTGTAVGEPRVNGNPNNFNNQFGPGEFQRTHTLVISPTFNMPYGFKTSMIFRMFSGQPWTPRYGFDINGDGSTNDRVYVPKSSEIDSYQFVGTAEEQARHRSSLVERIENTRCLRENRGTVMERNSCRNKGQNILDMKVSRRFSTARGQNVELVADFFNVLNGLNKEWGRRTQVPDANTSLLIPAGFNATTRRYAYRTNNDFGKSVPNTNFTTTQFQVQLGLRYNF